MAMNIMDIVTENMDIQTMEQQSIPITTNTTIRHIVLIILIHQIHPQRLYY